MIIELNVQVDGGRITVSAPQAGMWIEIKNVIAYDMPGEHIVAIGQTADDLQRANPQLWEKRRSTIRFSCLFVLENFVPEFAVVVFAYYASMARMKMQRRISWPPSFTTRFDCNLRFAGYEKLPPATRQEFEYSLRKCMLFKMHTLSINGQPSVLEPDFVKLKRQADRQRTVADWTLRLCGAFWMLSLFGLFWLILEAILSDGYLNKPLSWQDLPLLLVVLCGITIVIALGSFLGALSYVLLLRRFLPKPLLGEFLSGAQSGMPKFVTSWLATLVGDD